MGRYNEWEDDYNTRIKIAQERQDEEWLVSKIRDLGLCLAFQGKLARLLPIIDEAISLTGKWENQSDLVVFETWTTLGGVWLFCGQYEKSIEHLHKALDLGKKLRAHLHVLPSWLGIAFECIGELPKSQEWYQFGYDNSKAINRNYVSSIALTGLIRVKHAQGDIAAIPPLLAEAEGLAQQYEYNDHLASLRLTQGHLAWESGNQDEAISHYQRAMTYALRYNRFLLDELLSGRPQGTPLRPIIPYCLERDKVGREILRTLRDWWQTGINDIGTPRPDTISPIPEGLPLLDAEKLARQREPGDGSIQRSVVEQLETGIGN